MKRINNIKKAYFIGIGGIGMSALARYFHAMGIEVSGYDKTSTILTDSLMMEGIRIHFKEDTERIPKDVDMVVYTAAIPPDHEELIFYRANNFTVKKRAEVLGMISKGMFNISVAGSHGKTTVSTMIGHILKETGYDCTAFLGGVSVNYNTNLLIGENDLVVVEADEYDRSFLNLYPDIAVITAIDSDHLDIYGSMDKIENAFREFTSQISSDGSLVAKYNIPVIDGARCDEVVTYSLDEKRSDYYITQYAIENGEYVFDISAKGETFPGFRLKVGGLFNIENALAAIAVSNILGLEMEAVKGALYEFKGIKRRFEVIYKSDRHTYIDDYAHHPKEITALMRSVKDMYQDKKVTVIFQPHLYSRTQDLALEFAESLGAADELYLLDIYPAREKPIPGVTSALIYDKVSIDKKSMVRKEDLAKVLEPSSIEVLLTVGAGDIDQMIYSIKKQFENHEKDLE